jgi:hypothetical protein
MRIDWGNVPGGIGAVLTGISILIAAFTYRRSVKNAEMAQAEFITGWVINEHDIIPKDEPLGIPEAVVVVRNGSKQPAYMVEAQIVEQFTKGRVFIGTLPPESTRQIKTDVRMMSSAPLQLLTFTDAAGRIWERSEKGELRRITQARSSLRLYSARYAITHPIVYGRWIIPSRPYGRPPDSFDEVWQRRAVEAAVWEGHQRRKAQSAVAKYSKGRRLTLAEKRALSSASKKLPEGMIARRNSDN